MQKRGKWLGILLGGILAAALIAVGVFVLANPSTPAVSFDRDSYALAGRETDKVVWGGEYPLEPETGKAVFGEEYPLE